MICNQQSVFVYKWEEIIDFPESYRPNSKSDRDYEDLKNIFHLYKKKAPKLEKQCNVPSFNHEISSCLSNNGWNSIKYKTNLSKIPAFIYPKFVMSIRLQ